MYYLRLRDNKIIGLNFSNSTIDEYFLKFLEVMEEDGLYWYFQFINLGRCKLDSIKLIKLANFLISNYSEIERPYPTSMFRYLLLWDNMIYYNNRLDHITKKLSLREDNQETLKPPEDQNQVIVSTRNGLNENSIRPSFAEEYKQGSFYFLNN